MITTPIRRPSGRGGPGAGAVVAALVVAGLASIPIFADVLGIDHRTPFLQLIAFRWQMAAGVLVLGVLVWLLARSVWPVALGLVVVGLIGLLTVAPRAIGGGSEASPGGGDSISVLVLNTYKGNADDEALADLLVRRRPDVVVLPEAGGELRRTLTRTLDDEQGGTGYRSAVADRDSDDSPMTVFVSRELGRPSITADRETEFPWLIVDLPGDLRVVAAHPHSPRPGDTYAWRRDMAALKKWCSDDEPSIVAGDLNATYDHLELREGAEGCTDAASDVGEGLAGTWPSQLPSLLGAQIDHVLTANGPKARSVEFLDVPGTDHRAVLAEISR